MSCVYVDLDGKTVLKWDMVLSGGILLEDGRHLPEGQADARIFSVHPDKNRYITIVDGVYHFKGKSMKVSCGSPHCTSGVRACSVDEATCVHCDACGWCGPMPSDA
jgi:hypothetical protein